MNARGIMGQTGQHKQSVPGHFSKIVSDATWSASIYFTTCRHQQKFYVLHVRHYNELQQTFDERDFHYTSRISPLCMHWAAIF